MPSISRSPLVPCIASCFVLAVATPEETRAQNASIMVSATVQPRPLMLIDAGWTAVPGELRVRVDGCGPGALSVDLRTAASVRRMSRSVLESTNGCAMRTVMLQLPTASAGALDFVVTLEQSQSLLSPAFAQFVVPAGTLVTRSVVAY